jgi:ubiquinone/menaquinone biosynthesis C-methylase UbiE
MLKRIPHSDLQVITGENKTKNYLEMQKKMGRFYFKDFFKKFDRINQNGRFLEIGPGPGYQTALIADKYNPVEIIGLECSADMIKVAERFIHNKGLSETIKFVHGAVENTILIKKLGKFDVVYSTFSLHHWSNPEKGLKNLYNSLSETGILFIFDFYRGGILYHLNIKRGVWESIRASYQTEEIKKMLTELQIENYSITKEGLYMDFVIIKDYNE